MELREFRTSPADAQAYAERYVNDGSPSGFTEQHRTSPATDPFGLAPHFHLYSIPCPPGLSDDFGDSAALPHGVFLLHPDMLQHKDLAGLTPARWHDCPVTPTASARTVQLLGTGDRDYVKLHYDGVIGRINRQLPRRKAVNGVEMSAALLRALGDGQLPDTMALLHEPAARVLHNPAITDSRLHWSFVWRYQVPRGPAAPHIAFMIPMFSLWSSDRRAAAHPPLLAQLCTCWGRRAREMILDGIIRASLDAYFAMVARMGLQFELNAQNMLVGFDNSLAVVAVVVRDCMGIEKDLDLRTELGLSLSFAAPDYKVIGSSVDPVLYRVRHSFAFDFKLCEYIVRPLIEAGVAFGIWEREEARAAGRSLAARWIRELPPDYFPEGGIWYAHEEELLTGDRQYVRRVNPFLR